MKKRLLVVVLLLVALGSGWTVRELCRPFQGYSGSLLVVIEPGSHAADVAELLVTRGVLVRRLPFLFRYWLARPRHSLKAGEYLFDRPLRPLDVYRKLVQGEVYLHVVVIPEGSDRFDMARILYQRLGVDTTAFLRVTEQSALIRDLDPDAPTLEGYLFPDTYRFPHGASPAAVVAAMLGRFRHVLQSKFGDELPLVSLRLHEVVTLASLVEKETPDPSERAMVAGVFARRLQKGMPLQCDPTVVYAARLVHPPNGRPLSPITQSDLDLDSPYNTYRHAGLPPGPIASPGEASLRAALRPAPGDALYFVSNSRGGHIFARTLAQHQRNVARYRGEVAALRHNDLDKAKPSSRPLGRGGRGATTTSAKSAKHNEQKANHP